MNFMSFDVKKSYTELLLIKAKHDDVDMCRVIVFYVMS